MFKYHIIDNANDSRSCWVKENHDNSALDIGANRLRTRNVRIGCKKEFKLL
jgi:hypothetical protein